MSQDYESNPNADSTLTIPNIELSDRGWTCVKAINSRSALLRLARMLGRPVPSPTGEVIKELSPIPRMRARKGTFSEAYGFGSFPLHTDAAFWALPPRYLVFRAYGDIRRNTTILSFANLFRDGGPRLRELAERSLWLVRTPSQSVYCSMKFASKVGPGWRYDPHCMTPVNDAASEVRRQLDPLLAGSHLERIHWMADTALVLCNWKVLHGRGASPSRESNRIIERIYVQ